LLIKQAAAMGIRSTFLGGDAWDEIDKVAGKALEGSYQSAPWHPEVPFQRSMHLKNMYRQHLNQDIENYSAPLAYDDSIVSQLPPLFVEYSILTFSIVPVAFQVMG